jgi:hypothetical protein
MYNLTESFGCCTIGWNVHDFIHNLRRSFGLTVFMVGSWLFSKDVLDLDRRSKGQRQVVSRKQIVSVAFHDSKHNKTKKLSESNFSNSRRAGGRDVSNADGDS